MAKELNLLEILISLLRNKWKIIINFVIITILAVVLSLLLPKSYKSEIVFIPKSGSSPSLMSLLGNSLGGGLSWDNNLSKRQYVAILHSREVREELIEKFSLIKVYKREKEVNPLDQALRILEDNIIIDIEEEGGLGITDIVTVSITVVDKSPKRASDMANYLYSLLEKKVIELNSSEQTNIQSYLSKQINDCEDSLDSARIKLTQFQKENRIYNIPEQVKLTIQAVGMYQAELLSLEKEKAFLTGSASSNFGKVRVLNQRISTLKNKIQLLEKSQSKDLLLGPLASLDLNNVFMDFMKEVETYTQLSVLLRQQSELSKIKSNRDFSGIFLVDKARPAQYKFKPKRAFVVLGIVIPYMFFILSFIVISDYWRKIKKTNPEKHKQINDLLNSLKTK